MIEHLPVAEFILATIITAAAGVIIAIVRSVERYKTVKLTMAKTRKKDRPKVIKDVARLMKEPRRSLPWARARAVRR